jgi:hypothetical protein
MPKYIFVIKNGFHEDHIFDLQDDAAAIDEGLKTASGMVHDLSLTRKGTEIRTLDVREEGGEEILKVEIRAARVR